MEVILTCVFFESALVIYLNHMKYTEIQIIKKWKRGELSYSEILALKKEGLIHVRYLNKDIKIGKNPGEEKKND